jgi:hypothetical protein
MKKREKEDYTQEQVDQISQEIIECNYYPKDVTEADMRDYLAKEENNEAFFTSLENDKEAKKRMELGEHLLIDEITKRINKNFKDYGIEPTMETQIDANEEISLLKIKQYASMIKEMKAKFQVDKYRLLNTFRDKEALKTFTDEQIENHVLSMWHLKDCIEGMEKELRGWEEDVKQRYDD